MQTCVGDWIIYYEPVKVPETRGYFAVARVQQVIPDPGTRGMYLATIEPGSYLDFANPVPFSGPDGLVERGLYNEQGAISGRALRQAQDKLHRRCGRSRPPTSTGS